MTARSTKSDAFPGAAGTATALHTSNVHGFCHLAGPDILDGTFAFTSDEGVTVPWSDVSAFVPDLRFGSHACPRCGEDVINRKADPERTDLCPPCTAALFQPEIERLRAQIEDDDGEEFCPRCYAGVDSDEHHTKCVVTEWAIDGERASTLDPTWDEHPGARPAAQDAPAASGVGVEASEGATGAQGGAGGLGARIRSMNIGGFAFIRVEQGDLRALADRADELERDRDRWRDSAKYAVRQVERVRSLADGTGSGFPYVLVADLRPIVGGATPEPVLNAGDEEAGQ